MRWILLAAACLFAGGCQCAKTVDETGQKAAEEMTGHGTVKRGREAAKKIKQGLQEAEKVRDDKAEELLKGLE